VLVAGAVIDIHDERERVQALADTAARLALAEESARFGVWELDPVTRIVHLSAGSGAPQRAAAGGRCRNPSDELRARWCTPTINPRRTGCSRRR
jgi:hypothetical protein